MANTITKLTANGNYYLSGVLDEVSGTYSANGLICHWPTYSSYFIPGSQWIDIVNGNNLYIPTSNIYNPAYSSTYSNAVYATNNLFFGVGSTAYTSNIGQLSGATSCTIEGVIKIQALTGGMVLGFDHYDIYTGPNSSGFGYNTGNSDNYGITSTQFTSLGLPGNYAHYVFVFNTFPSGTGTYANNQIWINGVQQTLSQVSGLVATSGRGFNNGSGGYLPGSQFPTNYSFTINTWPNTYGSYTMNNGFGGLRMYNRTLTPAEIVQNYNVAASNPAFGLTPISKAPKTSLTINSTTQNSATFLMNSIDEVTFNPIQTGYRKNLLSYSQNFNSSGWDGANPADASAYITTNATTSPTGDNTGQKLYSAPAIIGSTIQRIYGFFSFIAGNTYTFSVYAKAAEYSKFWSYIEPASGRIGINVDLIAQTVSVYNGSPTNLFLTSVGNGWYRTGFTWVAPATESGVPVDVMRLLNNSSQSTFIGDGASGIYVWGAQLETGSQATIYEQTGANAIPTSNNLSKLDTAGNHYLLGSYDEYTRGFNIVQNGLIYYMDPSKPESWTGSNAIYDSTKTNPQGSIVGSYNYNIDGGGTIALDGLTAYANTGILGNTAPFQTTSEFTMSIWCKFTGPTKTTSGTSTLFGAFNFQGFGICWSPGTNNLPSAIYSVVRPNNGIEYGSYTSNATDFQLNRWYNYVFTYSGSNLANTSFLYVNSSKATGGVQYGSNLPYSTNMNGIYITIGNILPESGGPSGYFPGRIGQALIYNRALSASEIAQNFNEMRSQYGV